MKKLALIFCCMVVIFCFSYVSIKAYKYKSIKFDDEIRIGKVFTISINNDMLVDAQYLQDVKDLKVKDELGFLLFNNIELQELIDYMYDKKLYIKSGDYTVNQAWKFEELINNFSFESIN